MLVMVILLITSISPLQAAKYKAQSNSLTKHPDPQLFSDEKFGIHFHWGPILFLRTRQNGTPTICKSRDMRAMSTI